MMSEKCFRCDNVARIAIEEPIGKRYPMCNKCNLDLGGILEATMQNIREIQSVEAKMRTLENDRATLQARGNSLNTMREHFLGGEEECIPRLILS